MITKRNFSVYDTSGEASIKFEVKNGLQQGTVNSPILFNIFNSNILNLFELNRNPYKKGIAFVDDLIIYTIGKKPSIINKDLQEIYNKIQGYCNSWKLKINSNTSETILFRPRLSEANKDTKRH